MHKISDIFKVNNGITPTNMDISPIRTDEFSLLFLRPSKTSTGTIKGFVRVEDVPADKIFPEDTLFVSTNGEGSHSYSYVSSEKFCMNSDVAALIPFGKYAGMTLNEKLFYAMQIKSNRYKFSYGRKPKGEKLKNLEVVSPEDIPAFVNNTNVTFLSTNNKSPKAVNPLNWQPFSIDRLFTVTGTTTTPLEVLEEIGGDKYPYVTTQVHNNGVAGFYDIYTERGNVITIDSAVLGFASYQSMPFSASDHVEKLIPKFDMTPKIALFFVALINAEGFRYHYGRKYNQNNIKATIIRLPVKTNSAGRPIIDSNKTFSDNGYEPDWEYMSTYIESIPYADYI